MAKKKITITCDFVVEVDERIDARTVFLEFDTDKIRVGRLQTPTHPITTSGKVISFETVDAAEEGDYDDVS